MAWLPHCCRVFNCHFTLSNICNHQSSSAVFCFTEQFNEDPHWFSRIVDSEWQSSPPPSPFTVYHSTSLWGLSSKRIEDYYLGGGGHRFRVAGAQDLSSRMSRTHQPPLLDPSSDGSEVLMHEGSVPHAGGRAPSPGSRQDAHGMLHRGCPGQGATHVPVSPVRAPWQ